MSATLIAETIAASPVESLLEQLRAQGIRIPRPAEVRDYLEQFPELLPVVRQACELTVAEFAGKATLALEVYVDPEIDDPHLMLYVRQEPFDPASWPGFERVQQSYADALAELAGWLHVGPDFRAANRR
jgi:hypothetical protein